MTLFVGDCKEVLSLFYADNSFDAVVTDPPYGLSFMGKAWDYEVPQSSTWAEIFRVLKPGGYLLAFFGSRTYHRGAIQIEDAGFEIRDQIQWVYGSGYPKSHNGEWGGTALKPAHEPIVLARKPLIGTVDQNWREHGTGGLNIDECRVEWSSGSPPEIGSPGWGGPSKKLTVVPGQGGDTVARTPPNNAGRWPANLIHDGSDEVLAAFPDAKGQQGPVSGSAPSEKTCNVYGRMRREGEASADVDNEGAVGFKMKPGMRRLDEGSAARFFYCAKASKRDRDEGLDAFEAVRAMRYGEQAQGPQSQQTPRKPVEQRNTHPTVKPTDLMRYLCRLITPAGGTILDPFMGSGSTGKAAKLEGFNFVGIELDANNVEIAAARIAAA